MGRRRHRISGTIVRGLLACGTLGCCAPGCFFGGREPAVLTSNDPASKIPAIKKAAVAPRDSQTARQLVKSLESHDPAVRFYALRALQDLTGETFGYVWYADEAERGAALAKWNHWLGQNGNGSLAGAEPSQK